MVFSNIGHQKNKVNVLFTIEAGDEREAQVKAERFLDSLCTAILLSTNIAMDIEDIDIVEVSEVRTANSGKVKSIEIHEILRIKADVSVGLALSEPHLRNIVETAKRIESLDKKLTRLLRWYRRALLENDPIDKFTQLWIAFEIWATHKGYKKGRESERSKMVKALAGECKFSEKDADEMYGIRSALFHSGAYDKALNKLPLLEKCLTTIISEVKKTIKQ